VYVAITTDALGDGVTLNGRYRIGKREGGRGAQRLLKNAFVYFKMALQQTNEGETGNERKGLVIVDSL
jgi:hypothetical protein